MNLVDVRTLPTTPENGTWYRLIPPINISTALSSSHTKPLRSRWNGGALLAPTDQFAALYFADSPIVAQFEVGAMLGSLTPGGSIPNPGLSNFIILNVRIILHGVVDLTEVKNTQALLCTNAQELTGDWKGYKSRSLRTSISEPTGIAPTQELGKALFETGIEVKVPR